MNREQLISLSQARCQRLYPLEKDYPKPLSQPDNSIEHIFQITARDILRKNESPYLPTGIFLATTNASGYIQFIKERPSQFPLPYLLTKGALWSEEAIGTNGLAIALLDQTTIPVFGQEHYLPQLQDYFSVGIPFKEPEGTVAGAILLVGRLLEYCPKLLHWLEELHTKIKHQVTTHLTLRNQARGMLLEENIRLSVATQEGIRPELGIAIINSHKELINANLAAQQLLKKKSGDYLQNNVSVLEQELIDSAEKCLKTGTPYYKKIVTPANSNGTSILIYSQPLKSTTDRTPLGVLVIICDLQQAFPKTTTTYHALTWLDDDVVVLDRNGNIVFGNRFQADDIGQNYINIVFNGEKLRPDGQHNSLLIQALETGTNHIGRIYQTPDGKRTRQTDIHLLHNQHGSIVGAVGIRKDITEKQQLKTQLIHSERLATIGELTAQTIHELRNPLAAIRASAQLALCLDCSEKDAAFQQIIKEIDKINDFVSSILILAKPEQASYQGEDLAALLDSVLDLVNAKTVFNHLTIKKQFDHSLPLIKANPKLLEQALLNVISNAIDATDRGGILTLTIINHPERHCQELIVADTGCGIEPDVLEHLFQPFYTTKGDSGTGLGLTITHQIITEGHNGRIWIESEVERGTQVHIELPNMEENL